MDCRYWRTATRSKMTRALCEESAVVRAGSTRTEDQCVPASDEVLATLN